MGLGIVLFMFAFHNFSATVQTNVKLKTEVKIMKKLWVGMALGVVAGCLLAENPSVQSLVDSGKRKFKKLVK